MDGESHNRSWNCGVEGPTDDSVVMKLRNRQRRNLITTLFLSQGVPMLVAGDEIGRTQGGNNNAYCQDNETSWLHWDQADEEFLKFTQHIINLRKNHPTFCRRRWFQGQPIKGIGLEDIAWFLPDGSEMSDEHWNNDFAKSLAIYLNGRGIHSVGPKGESIMDDSFYLIFNAHHEPLKFTLPPEKYARTWIRILDTSYEDHEEKEFVANGVLTAEGRSIIVLKHQLLYGNARDH
jgi:glycogen operon protein